VRTSYPLLGMGIGFTDISKEAQVQLEELILSCAGGLLRPNPGPMQRNRSPRLLIC